MGPPELSLAFARARLGSAGSQAPVRLDRGRAAVTDSGGGVYRLHVGARTVVLKHFAASRPFVQAQAAYHSWLAAGELGGARVPRLIAADETSRSLLLTDVEGEAVDARDPRVHAAAGRFLAALHRHGEALDDEDPMPLVEALSRRHRSWLEACAPGLTRDQRALVDAHAEIYTRLGELHRVPCHRDFSPDNWLWVDGRLAVVDFEHARGDFAFVDLAKLAVGTWRLDGELGAAFWLAYRGGDLERERLPRLRAAVLLHGLASLAWGLRHHEPRFVDEGHRALAWMRFSTTQAGAECL